MLGVECVGYGSFDGWFGGVVFELWLDVWCKEYCLFVEEVVECVEWEFGIYCYVGLVLFVFSFFFGELR